MHTFLDRETLTISYEAGECDTVVVAFTGIGHALGGIQKAEFGRSLGELGLLPSSIYVIDRHRRWFNHGLASQIEDAVSQLVERLGARRAVTLGNSMGGFGAIAFARRVPGCAAAVAFCPQSSVHPEVAPFERRWREYVEAIRDWDLPDSVTEIHTGIRYSIFYGERDKIDLQHARRLSTTTGDVRIQLEPNCGHEVAAKLKADGRLKAILAKAIWEFT
jgi:pimeloyl-ACP methyl ester carboxylesterase